MFTTFCLCNFFCTLLPELENEYFNHKCIKVKIKSLSHAMKMYPLIKHHAMKAQVSGSIAPHILNLRTRGK
jgi:hypothetical protein